MDSSTGMNSGQEVSSSIPVSTPSDESHTQNVSSGGVNEKTFTQSEVNEIVKQRMERERRTRETQPEYAQRKYSDNFSQTPDYQSGHDSNVQSISNNDEKIRQIVAEEARRQREEFEKQTLERQQQEQAQMAATPHVFARTDRPISPKQSEWRCRIHQ